MDLNKIKYTIRWTEYPEHWHIPGATQLISCVRKQLIEHEQKTLEEFSIKETNALIERLTCKK